MEASQRLHAATSVMRISSSARIKGLSAGGMFLVHLQLPSQWWHTCCIEQEQG